MPGRESPLSSVQKACRILGVLADAGRARLTEISVKATLNKVTTLRILDVLTREGFVERDERSKTYRLGDQSLVLASAARTRDDLRARTGIDGSPRCYFRRYGITLRAPGFRVGVH